MRKSYSIAEARSQLSELIHEAERGRAVELTRRGKAVAVLLSVEEHRRLTAARPSFAEAYGAWRQSVGAEELELDPMDFNKLRDRSPGRDVKL